MLEMADLHADRQGSKLVVELKKVKDAIGEWHDWEELIALANKVLDHGNRCLLKRRLKSISEKKFHSALSLANGLRHRFAFRGANAPLVKVVSGVAE